MRVQWAVLTLVLGWFCLSAEQTLSQDGQPFAPKNQMFTIIIPAGGKAAQRTRILTLGRHRVPVEESQSVFQDGTSFLGGSIGIPAVVMRDIPAGQRFDILRDAIVKPLQGKVTEEKDIKQDPVPGKEYQVELPRGAARMQIYTIAGFVVCALVEGTTREQVNSNQAEVFFGSLKLTDKAKEVFRQVNR